MDFLVRIERFQYITATPWVKKAYSLAPFSRACPLRDACITRRFGTVPRLLIFAKGNPIPRDEGSDFRQTRPGPSAIYNQVPRKMTMATRKFDHDPRHFDERGDERRREDRAETDAEGSPDSAVMNRCASAVNPAG